MKKTETKDQDHYWICWDCATEKGWKHVDHAVTMVKRECPYCDKVSLLSCSHTDYIKPGQKTKVWD